MLNVEYFVKYWEYSNYFKQVIHDPYNLIGYDTSNNFIKKEIMISLRLDRISTMSTTRFKEIFNV